MIILVSYVYGRKTKQNINIYTTVDYYILTMESVPSYFDVYNSKPERCMIKQKQKKRRASYNCTVNSSTCLVEKTENKNKKKDQIYTELVLLYFV